MSDDSAVVTDEEVRQRLVTAIDDTERTTSDFRAILAGESDSITLSNGKAAPSVASLVLNRASSLMTRAVDAGNQAVTSADDAATSARNASSDASAARAAASRTDTNLEAMGSLVTRSETSASNAQTSAAEALKSQQAAEQAAESASGAALGDVGSAQITTSQNNITRSINAWIEQFSRANIVLDNVAALRAVNVEFNGQRFFLRYHTYRGYGGGTFVADTGDKSSKDNNGTVIVGKNGVRFKRELNGEAIGNILLWGADPSGVNDSSQAFQNPIDDDNVRTIEVPHTGIFTIKKTVTCARIESYDSDGKPVRWGYDNNGKVKEWTNRKNIQGNFWGHFGFYSDIASVQAHRDLDGPMFYLAYNVRGIGFNAPDSKVSGRKYVALYMEGYVNKVAYCTFAGFDYALHTFQAVNFDITCVLASKCKRVLYCDQSNGINTTINMQGVLCQYCDMMIECEGELWGSTLQQCTWEVCNDHIIFAKTIFNCHFAECWIERGGDTESPKKIFNTKVGGGQQIRKCTEMGCSFHYSTGWVNPFDPEDGRVSGRFGGVSLGQNSVVVSEATGSGVRMDVNGINQMMDPWKESKSFTIKSARNEFGGMPLILKSEAQLDLETPSYVRFTNPGGGSSSTTVRWPQKMLSSSSGTDGNIELLPNRAKQIRMSVPVIGTDPADASKKVIRYAMGAIPFFMKWNGPYDRGRGTNGFELFDQSRVNSDNTIEVWNDNHEFKDPFIFFECEDADIKLDRWDAISAYSGSWSAYSICKGVKLYFRRISTGELVAPARFKMQFSSQ